jgi:thiamine-monophosphate kinase
VKELDWVLFGGEDHSFLTTFPADAALPRGFKAIGKVVSKGDAAVLFDGKPLEPKGWDSVSS